MQNDRADSSTLGLVVARSWLKVYLVWRHPGSHCLAGAPSQLATSYKPYRLDSFSKMLIGRGMFICQFSRSW